MVPLQRNNKASLQTAQLLINRASAAAKASAQLASSKLTSHNSLVAPTTKATV